MQCSTVCKYRMQTIILIVLYRQVLLLVFISMSDMLAIYNCMYNWIWGIYRTQFQLDINKWVKRFALKQSWFLTFRCTNYQCNSFLFLKNYKMTTIWCSHLKSWPHFANRIKHWGWLIGNYNTQSCQDDYM